MGLKMFVFVLIFLFSFAYVSAVIPGDCASGIVSYWKFDGNYIDSVGSNNGVNNGLSTYDIISKVNQSLAFGLGEGYVKINNDTTLKPSQLTIEGWFYLSSDAPPIDNVILNKQGDYKIWVNSSNVLKASINGVTLDTGVTVVVNRWVFFALTWDSTNAKFYMYDSSHSFESVVVTQPVSVPLTGTSDLLLGKALVADDYNFVGYMDEFAFYNQVLDTTTIKKHLDNSNLYKIGYCSVRTGVTSSTTKNLQVPGCNIGGTGGEQILINGCSDSGEWACISDGYAENTLETDKACSFGYDLASAVDFCCPLGTICNSADDNNDRIYETICRQRVQDCSFFDGDEQECIDNQCYYVNGKCVEDISALGCSEYVSKQTCETDRYDLGKSGSGTAICGQYTDDGYLVPESSCYCFWNNSDKCELHYNSTRSRYGTEGPNLFQCFKYFNNSDCVDGKQIVNWTVSYDPGLLIEPELTLRLQNASCYNGTQEKQCGQAIVKVPGFGFMNVIFVFLGLGIFYLISRKLYG